MEEETPRNATLPGQIDLEIPHPSEGGVPGGEVPTSFPAPEGTNSFDESSMQINMLQSEVWDPEATSDQEQFNPARIPLDMTQQDQDALVSRQVPVEEILEHIDAHQDRSPDHLPTIDVIGESYEHQNISETAPDGNSELEPMLPESVAEETYGPADQAQEETLIVHASDSVLNPQTVFDTFDADDDPFASVGSQTGYGHAVVDTVLADEQETLQELPQTLHGNDQSDGEAWSSSISKELSPSSPHHQDKSPILVDTSLTVDIPDDLDEADFDIDNELDAEFAALEATFQHDVVQPPPAPGPIMAQGQHSNGKPSDSIAAQPSSAAINNYKPVNPYKPVSDLPVQEQQQQQETGLFTPAQMGHSISRSFLGGNLYTPVGSTIANAPTGPLPSQSKNASAPSYVSGKVAYNDPYALPDTLVAKKRSRPQTQQTLRSAISVPNLKAPAQSRPLAVQRHASAAMPPPHVNQYQAPSQQGPSSVQNNYQKPPNPGTFGRSQMAAPSSSIGPNSQLVPDVRSKVQPASANNMPNKTPFHHPSNSGNTYESHGTTNSTQRSPPRVQGSRGAAVPGSVLSSGPRVSSPINSAFPNQMLPARPANPYTPAPTNTFSPSNEQPPNIYAKPGTWSDRPTGTSPPPVPPPANVSRAGSTATLLQHQRSSPLSESIDQVMRGGPSPIPHDFFPRVASSLGHERQPSDVSTPSGESDSSRHNAYEDFLDSQRGAENRMFGDSYAVAHEDIQEAQSIQRAGSATNLRYHPSKDPGQVDEDLDRFRNLPRTRPEDHTVPQSIPSGTRRSLDGRPGTASLEMSRPPSRSANGRYASTEPSSSPRQNNAILGNFPSKSATTGSVRPVPLSRATSSMQAYQDFPRSGSPLPSPQGPMSMIHQENPDPATGHPIACFGFGGRLLTTIPKTIPRFSQQGVMVHQIAGPGCVNIRPLANFVASDVLGDFPGPLAHSKSLKQKKTDLQLWFAKRVPPGDAITQDDKTILFRLLMLFLEFNGSIQTPAARQRIAGLLCPELAVASVADDSANFKIAASISQPQQDDDSSPLSTSSLTDKSIETLASLLIRGNRENALRFACDKGLWAHALVIATRMTPQAWSNVVKEFASVELQASSESSENLRFLYEGFADAHAPESLPAPTSVGSIRNWRKALTMILNNQGPKDDPVITRLGQSLLAGGQVYAAHFCFLLCSRIAVGPFDDLKVAFCLVGQGDLENGGWTQEKNESIIMTEILEFAMTLAQPKFLGLPHLLAFKLQRAHLLADGGLLLAAKRYCEGITTALKLLPKGSAHLHMVLVEQLRDLTHRIDQNPGEENPSWLGAKLAKPKMDNIWGSLEGKFNKFVSGESEQQTSTTDHDLRGPFGKLAQAPALSRVQSVVDLRHRAPSQVAIGHDAEHLRQSPSLTQSDQNAYPYAIPPQQQGHEQQYAPYAYGPSAQNVPEPVPQQAGMPFPIRQNSSQTLYQSSTNVQLNQYAPPQSITSPFQTRQASSYTDLQTQQSYQGTAAPPGLTKSSFVSIPDGGQVPAATAQNPYSQGSIMSEQSYQTASGGSQPSDHAAAAVPVPDAAPAVETPEEKAEVTPTDAKSTDSAEKKAGWLGGWFGGAKKKEPAPKEGDVKVHKAKLGEGMSLVYDPVTKKWTNPKGTMPEDTKSSAPPPPMSRKAPTPSPVMPQGQFSAAPPGPQQSLVTSQPLNGPSVVGTSTGTLSPAMGPPGALKPGGVPRKLVSAEDDLAAMLGSGPVPRRAASAASGTSTPTGTTRSKKTKPAKRYVDVFQEGN